MFNCTRERVSHGLHEQTSQSVLTSDASDKGRSGFVLYLTSTFQAYQMPLLSPSCPGMTADIQTLVENVSCADL